MHIPLVSGIALCLLAAILHQPVAILSDQSAKNQIQAHLGKAHILLQERSYEQAAQEFQAALTLDPGLTKARFELGVCYFASQQFKEARREFERLDSETKGDPGALYYLGRLDLLEDNLEGAISKLEMANISSPFSDAPFYLGSAYLKAGRLEPAEKWLKKAAELDPKDFRVPERLARVRLRAGDRGGAEQQFALSASLRQQQNDTTRQGIDCVQALKSQILDDARKTCQKLFDRSDPDKLLTLGMIYGQHEFPQEAIEPFTQAVRLDPESFEAQHNLGLTYFRLKRYSDARGPLEAAVTLRPDYYGSNALLGAALYVLKEDEEAYRVLQSAHSLNPQDSDTARILFKTTMAQAEKAFARKAYRESLEFLQQAAQLQPADATVHFRLGDVYALLGEKELAAQEKARGEELSRTQN